MLIDACWSCATGLHAECYAPVELPMDSAEFPPLYACCCSFDAPPAAVERNGVGRPMLSPDEITDIKSTGRKRAAMLAPIFAGMVCEWAGLRYAGGGVIPIVGCVDTVLEDAKGKGDRHHGPDKNVLNNAVGTNLHRICTNCHHRWHALNDPFYPAERPPTASEQYLPSPPHKNHPHDPITLASDDDIELSTAYWELRTEKRGEYPFAPTEERGTLNAHHGLDTE